MTDVTQHSSAPFADEAIDATMSATFDRMMEGEERPEPKVTTEIKAEAAPAPEVDEPTADETPEEAEPEREASLDAEGEPETDPAPAAQPVDAPARWSAEERQEFAKLSPEVQHAVLRRESEREAHFTKRTQELSEQRKKVAAIEELIEPRRQAWAMEHGSAEAAMGRLLAISDYASQDPAGFIKRFADQHRLDLAQITNQEAGADHDVDPAIAATQRRVDELERTIKASAEARQREAAAETQARIETFAKDRPHFEAVRLYMAALLQQGRAASLDDAYDQAVWANPETRAAMLADQQRAAGTARAEAERKRLADAKAATAKAKRTAGTRIVANGVAPGGGETPLSLDETIERAYDLAVGAA